VSAGLEQLLVLLVGPVRGRGGPFQIHHGGNVCDGCETNGHGLVDQEVGFPKSSASERRM
jgi:hypothetical protein